MNRNGDETEIKLSLNEEKLNGCK
ncbi:hypothetical protein C5167_018355 [Papaver somniferum]|uniref:Uncharacterized protein n=1 Tax=Papaver somniferum TaxID=3469 RepID=A0A4Y7IQ55_PAPSO|nr:hypothetical protein C5167_018355 [Papaver somniferum]